MTVTGAPVPKATPAAVAIVPSMPLAPRLVATSGFAPSIAANMSPSRTGMLLPSTRAWPSGMCLVTARATNGSGQRVRCRQTGIECALGCRRSTPPPFQVGRIISRRNYFKEGTAKLGSSHLDPVRHLMIRVKPIRTVPHQYVWRTTSILQEMKETFRYAASPDMEYGIRCVSRAKTVASASRESCRTKSSTASRTAPTMRISVEAGNDRTCFAAAASRSCGRA